MNATETAKLLRRLGACAEAREWAAGHTLAWAWEHCDRIGWMKWLSGALGAELMAPARAEYDRVMAPALAEYDRVTAPALAEYDRVTAPALAEYDRVMAPARAEYDRVRAAAWAEYDRVRAAAYRAAIPYEQIEAAARAVPGGEP